MQVRSATNTSIVYGQPTVTGGQHTTRRRQERLTTRLDQLADDSRRRQWCANRDDDVSDAFAGAGIDDLSEDEAGGRRTGRALLAGDRDRHRERRDERNRV